jgi:hypothetical protein
LNQAAHTEQEQIMISRKCKRSLAPVVALATGLIAISNVGSAHAQNQGYGSMQSPGQRPTTSPYLNILRSGGSPAINYYGVVRPEVNFSNSLFQMQTQQGTLAAQQQDLMSYTAVPPTGHAAGFGTQTKYFMRPTSMGQTPTGYSSGGIGAGLGTGIGGVGGNTGIGNITTTTPPPRTIR